MPGSGKKQDDREGRANPHLPWALTALPENELRTPTSQDCCEGCQRTKIIQFSNECDGLYSRENNLQIGGSYCLISSGALFSSENEFHGALEEAMRKQA